MAKDKDPAKVANSRRAETTARNKERLLDALERSKGLVYMACRFADVHHKTYYKYLDEDPEFAEKVKELIEHQIDVVEGGLIHMTESESEKIRIAASDIYLKAKAKERGYGTLKQELSGDLKHNHTIEVVRFEMPENGTDEGQRSPKPPEWTNLID